MEVVIPHRGDGSQRPGGIVVPPARMRPWASGRPLKAWSYAAVFDERIMLCAATVRIGVVPQVFWAVWDRERRALRERTVVPALRPGVRVRPPRPGAPGAVGVHDATVSADLSLEAVEAVETTSPHGPAWIWTRKQGGVRVRGTVRLAGEEIAVDGHGCVDESAGYHARRTAWEWSAGVGETDAGARVAWNLVTGVHDDPRASERSVWVDGRPHEVAPVRFSQDLDEVTFSEGTEKLCFREEARRARRDDLVVFRSDYVQPFGTFSGSLPGAGQLAWGRGVMERHSAVW